MSSFCEHEHTALQNFFYEVKKLAIINQCYEIAAASRDAERTISSDKLIDVNAFYEKAKYLMDNCPQTNSMRSDLEAHFEKLHSVKAKIRSEIISKILKDSRKS